MVSEPSERDWPASRGSLVQALLVHVERLAAGARVLLVGDEDPALEEQLHELGARQIHAAASVDALDVRDASFDLAVVSDLGREGDAADAVRRLRRTIAPSGAVVAIARARTDGDEDAVMFPEIAPAAVGYAELYDLFALGFDNVTMSGVLPFEGVVFAQLGADEDVPVGVDTQLVPPPAPTVFVVVASRDPVELDPYAIVQVPESADPARQQAAEAALAAAILESRLLSAQLEEQLARNASVDSRATRELELASERDVVLGRLAEIAAERDAALSRGTELESVLVAAQQVVGTLERRVEGLQQTILERDQAIGALRGALDAKASERDEAVAALRSALEAKAREHHEAVAALAALRGTLDTKVSERDEAVAALRSALDARSREPVVDPEILGELRARAERAEALRAEDVADVAQIADSHALEIANLEAQLRERASVIAAMEKELARREHLVRELVGTLEEVREAGADAVRFEPTPAPAAANDEEIARLTRKIEELALEMARREGELVAQSWRIEELENDRAPRDRAPAPPAAPSEELARARDEIDALRQALTQEHAARLAAESGEELVRARAELAQKAALLEQMKARTTQASD